ncbi:unnamed protein product [Fusarium graminearum]|uniref:Chromosome 2, complete genome n=2 Tax=Gibberella zeae TaxID=5518 RepID=A0A098DF92_GIBZE|nr:unnamed protein product [Fusarium graminearum]CAF3486944.1 unnamed protein product [Fusarium graminearum]CAG1976926.1 unnamed protein product [Fusarium graminearum]CAG2006868.1 unnamed protein product [Fusarium graminearum]CEF76626.1 unnamed protein product [Fusarium graminearum]
MGSLRTGVEHYMEPLPFRREPLADRPLLFSEKCDRGHRPSSFDMSLISNFKFVPKKQTSAQFWASMLEELEKVITSIPSGERSCSSLESLPSYPFTWMDGGRSRNEFPVSPLGDSATLASSRYASPLEGSSGTLIREYEYEPVPSTTQSEFWSSRTSVHELGVRPASAPNAQRIETPQRPHQWATQKELSPSSYYISSDEESFRIDRENSPFSPWDEDLEPSPVVYPNASPIYHGASTPRLFLAELSSPGTAATGEYLYTRSSAFASTTYGTFAVQIPFTARSPTWSEYERDIILYDDSMDDSDSIEDFVCIFMGAFISFVAASTYAFVLLVIVESWLK